MKYYSTRDAAVRMDAAEAIKMGLSRDGGLLTPCEIPQIDRAFLESLVNARYQERAARVMGLYLTDYTYEELSAFAENAYGPEKFDTDAVAPVRTVDGATHCLELWHGPTSAFKDMALQMLPQMLSPDLGRDLGGLGFEPLQLLCFQIMGEHLKIHPAIVAPEDADEAADDV